MIEQGTVTTARPGEVDVVMSPSAECADCGACSQTAGGGRLLEGVRDTRGAKPGDVVSVETPASGRRRAQVLVYIVPVAALLVGYLAGFLLGNLAGIAPDASGAAAAIAAGALALVLLRRVGSGTADGDRYQPQVRAIISRGREACR